MALCFALKMAAPRLISVATILLIFSPSLVFGAWTFGCFALAYNTEDGDAYSVWSKEEDDAKASSMSVCGGPEVCQLYPNAQCGKGGFIVARSRSDNSIWAADSFSTFRQIIEDEVLKHCETLVKKSGMVQDDDGPLCEVLHYGGLNILAHGIN